MNPETHEYRVWNASTGTCHASGVTATSPRTALVAAFQDGMRPGRWLVAKTSGSVAGNHDEFAVFDVTPPPPPTEFKVEKVTL